MVIAFGTVQRISLLVDEVVEPVTGHMLQSVSKINRSALMTFALSYQIKIQNNCMTYVGYKANKNISKNGRHWSHASTAYKLR